MKLPVEICPQELGNRRDEAQASVMTVHPKLKNGEFGNLKESYLGDRLQKAIVPMQSKPEILEILAREHFITEETLFNGVLPSTLKFRRDWANAHKLARKQLEN